MPRPRKVRREELTADELEDLDENDVGPTDEDDDDEPGYDDEEPLFDPEEAGR